MVKRIGRRFVSLLLTFVTILTMLPAMTLPALAAFSGPVSGLTDTSIGLSFNGDANDAWSAEDTRIIGRTKGKSGRCGDTHYASTLTITNKKDKTATLSFDYAIELNSGTIQVDGTSVTAGGKFSKKLDPNSGTATVYIKSGSTSKETKITMTNVKLIYDTEATVTFQPAENGSYTVGSTVGRTTITEEWIHTQRSTTAYQVNATPGAGYQFMDWYDVSNNKSISRLPKTELNIEKDCTIKARFTTSGLALFETGGLVYDDLTNAITAASEKPSAIITQVGDGTISGSYAIPSSVTLLIPFDEGGTLYTDVPGYVEGYQTPSAFRKLTMAPGSSITVNGAISVGGKHTYQMGKQGPSGPYGQIDMAAGSSITLNSKAYLYAWGYITGDGAITAASGSKVYEFFQLRDWRGGTATLAMNNNNKKVFPVSQYYVQNIESTLTIQAGAQELTYLTISADGVGIKSVTIDFIGDSNSNSLFKIANRGTLTKKYDPETDRMTYTTTGSATLASLNLSVASYKLSSGSYVLPVNNNMTLEISSGSVEVNCDAALLPGAQITIAQGAALNVASGKSLYVYDLVQWKKDYAYNSNDFGYAPVLYSPTKTGTRTLTNAKIDVNGTLTAAGSVYTTLNGADICSSEGSGKYVQQSNPGTNSTTHQAKQNDKSISYDSIPITPAKLKNKVGGYTETNTASAGDTFTYCTCPTCGGGKWTNTNDLQVAEIGTKQYGTLQAAVNAPLSAGQYIKMLHNTTEKNITADKNLYLDLNGRTVTGNITVGSGFTLYGMDSATDEYDGTNAGKIDGTVTGNVALVHETSAKTVDGYDSLRYVAIKNEDGTEYTFHRFNISVTGYRFELAAPKCALFFIGKFRGDEAAKNHLKSLGFTLTDIDGETTNLSYEIPAVENIPSESDPGESPVVRSTDGAFLFEAYLIREIDKGKPDTYQKPFSATAKATFKNSGPQEDNSLSSVERTLSFQQALWDALSAPDMEEKDGKILRNFLNDMNIPNPNP